jgi:hypothetical protein
VSAILIRVFFRRSSLDSILLLLLASACADVDASPIEQQGTSGGGATNNAGRGGSGNVTAGTGGSGGTSGGVGGSAGIGGSPSGDAGTPDAGGAGGESPTGMQVFLLFGQSNMEGVPAPEAADLVENPRVEVLGYTTCGTRVYNEWAVARPPLHSCGLGVGPGDAFGKAMAEAWPNATIGLVPAAISGVDIAFYRKGVVSTRRGEFSIPPDNTDDSAYDMLLEKAQLAQQRGTIRGILFHQGESDGGNSQWVSQVTQIVLDLRTDLGLGEDVPFIAGELLYSQYTGCCQSFNTRVNQLPGSIPNAHVVSAAGLANLDTFHFDLPGQRELGARYAEAMLEALSTP